MNQFTSHSSVSFWDFARDMARAQKEAAGLSVDSPKMATDHEAYSAALSEAGVQRELAEANAEVDHRLSDDDIKRIHEAAKADEVFSEGRQIRRPFRINPHGE